MDFQVPLRAPAYNVMAKPIGPVCNLNCTYCYYLEKKQLFEAGSKKMSRDTLELFIKEYISAQKTPVVSFVWHGGEPTLLGQAYFEEIVTLQNAHAGKKKIENHIQTNGISLDDRFCEFFKTHDFLVGVSIDGPRELHDHYRIDSMGQPTWARTMEGIRCLQKHGVRFNTLSVVNDKTARHPLEVYHFLKNTGSHYMQFLPVVERTSRAPSEGSMQLVDQYQKDAQVTDWSVLPIEYGKFMARIFDEWVANDVGRYYVQLFDTTLANWTGNNPGLCVFQKECGTAPALEYNGNVYACDHFVYDDYYLGNIHDTSLAQLVTSPKQLIFGKDKRASLPACCRACNVLFACNGGCPKHRFNTTPEGSEGLNYLCEGYSYFFHHVKPCMDFMARELEKNRPPANVMHWVRKKTQAPLLKTPGRNQPCPCGSGKKYKHCHAKKQ